MLKVEKDVASHKQYFFPIHFISPLWSYLDKPKIQIESIRHSYLRVSDSLLDKLTAYVSQDHKTQSATPLVPPNSVRFLPGKVISSAMLVDTCSLFSDITSSQTIAKKLECLNTLKDQLDEGSKSTFNPHHVGQVDVKTFLNLEAGKKAIEKALELLFLKITSMAEKFGFNAAVVSIAGNNLKEMIFDDSDNNKSWEDYIKAAAVEHVFEHQCPRRLRKYVNACQALLGKNITNKDYESLVRIAWMLNRISSKLRAKDLDFKTTFFNAWAKSSVITSCTNTRPFEKILSDLIEREPWPQKIHKMVYQDEIDPDKYISRSTEDVNPESKQKIADAKPAYYRALTTFRPLYQHWRSTALQKKFLQDGLNLGYYKDQDIFASIRTQLKGTRKHYRRERSLITYAFLVSYIESLEKIFSSSTQKFTIVMHHRTGLSKALSRCAVMINAQLNLLFRSLFKDKGSQKAFPCVQLKFTSDDMLAMLDAKQRPLVKDEHGAPSTSVSSAQSQSSTEINPLAPIPQPLSTPDLPSVNGAGVNVPPWMLKQAKAAL